MKACHLGDSEGSTTVVEILRCYAAQNDIQIEKIRVSVFPSPGFLICAGRCAYRDMPGKIASRRPGMVDEKVHPVEEIDFADARIRIQEQQVDVRILLLQTFLHTFGDDVVGDAAKRLKTQHIMNTRPRQGCNFTGNQPTFAILMV